MGTERFVDLIQKKKSGETLTKEEIDFMITDYVAGKIPDYQMSAMLMAIYFNGMENEELAAFTLAMRDSGDLVDLSPIEGIKVDKHSTGGVGDKTTPVSYTHLDVYKRQEVSYCADSSCWTWYGKRYFITGAIGESRSYRFVP